MISVLLAACDEKPSESGRIETSSPGPGAVRDFVVNFNGALTAPETLAFHRISRRHKDELGPSLAALRSLHPELGNPVELDALRQLVKTSYPDLTQGLEAACDKKTVHTCIWLAYGIRTRALDFHSAHGRWPLGAEELECVFPELETTCLYTGGHFILFRPSGDIESDSRILVACPAEHPGGFRAVACTDGAIEVISEPAFQAHKTEDLNQVRPRAATGVAATFSSGAKELTLTGLNDVSTDSPGIELYCAVIHLNSELKTTVVCVSAADQGVWRLSLADVSSSLLPPTKVELVWMNVSSRLRRRILIEVSDAGR
jgi:hypothetical protein